MTSKATAHALLLARYWNEDLKSLPDLTGPTKKVSEPIFLQAGMPGRPVAWAQRFNTTALSHVGGAMDPARAAAPGVPEQGADEARGPLAGLGLCHAAKERPRL